MLHEEREGGTWDVGGELEAERYPKPKLPPHHLNMTTWLPPTTPSSECYTVHMSCIRQRYRSSLADRHVLAGRKR